ncbi:MAG: ASCH domain-containing protein [bacterium]
MAKKSGFIEKILDGTKTIESRWYLHRVKPWGSIQKGDKVYFKYSGDRIKALAKVSNVLQFDHLTVSKSKEILMEYGDRIGLNLDDYKDWCKEKNYCVLIFLEDPEEISELFKINKKGFGSACAWLTLEDIQKIKMS